jgi:hypothetical protein
MPRSCRCSIVGIAFIVAGGALGAPAEAASNGQLLATPVVAASVHTWNFSLARVSLFSPRTTRYVMAKVERMPERRPAILIPLYVSFAGLQAMDAHSTLRAVERGYTEANPLMAAATKNRGALIAVKLATTAAVIASAERLWRRNRVAAVVAVVAINGAYAGIVAHNYRRAGTPVR